ncbi:M81 family metallopeptidase [Pseudogemmobacter blasticus]|uniref:Microcystinase C n=1 Tax=Fuscovulum blasticum DSM 2131 TaxID=1188250 RepID=A0A2T4JBS8_FUSBL|nr:M81 family metallopeptidase [Fuscovulum blasticum]PTE15349.1 microcystin degradation protein MlrC [Fuscovulum blasticum DSM 2131]
MPFHVLTGAFVHESNTFKKGETTLQDFRDDVLDLGQTAIDRLGDVNDELAGFLDAGRAAGWKVTHTVSAHATPGARVSREAFDHIAGLICDAAAEHRATLDGILLSLHGSMVPAFCEDGEGELLRRLRAIVGPDLPIAATLDLHAMVTPAMVEQAQILVSYKTYPHIDMRKIGRQAGQLLDATLRGAVTPRTLRVRIPMLDEANAGRTDVADTAALYADAAAHEAEPGILAVSVNAGFSEADIPDMGPTVLVTFDRGHEDRAQEIANGLARRIWDGRGKVGNTFLTPDQAAQEARDFTPGNGPLVIADYADNPGAGAYGDATALLQALLAAGAAPGAFAPMIDPEAAAILHRHKVGDTVTLDLGGKCDPSFGGGPLHLTGEVVHLSDGTYTGDGPILGGITHSFGPTAVFRVQGIDVLVVSLPGQMLDLQQVRAFGIEPDALRFLVVKSMQHFRAAYEPIAGRVIVCDSGALATPQAHLRPYTRVQRPVWPLDADTTFQLA